MVTWPIDPPDGLSFAVVEVARQSVSGLSVSPYSLSQEAYEWPGQGWALAVTLPANGDRRAQRALDVFLARLSGRAGTFRMALPDHDPCPDIVVNPVIAEAAAARSERVVLLHVRNAGLNAYPVLEPGHVIEIAGRIHMVTEAGETEACSLWVSAGVMDFSVPVIGEFVPDEGLQELVIWPRLKSAVEPGDAVEAMEPRGLWRLSDDRQGYALDLVHRANSLKFVEAQ